ncbi:MAG: zf-HC2 domain-containing protein [Candidatus Omnitrophota bacterium]|jgi:predicted anti-sigma-YlaC factor YlaD
MKDCAKAKKFLSRYIDGQISDKESLFVKAHLSHCLLCSKEYFGLLEVKQLMSAKERKSLPPDYLVFRLRQEISGQRQAQERPSWIAVAGDLSRRLIPVPAAVVALSLVFMTFSLKQQAGRYSLDEHILSGSGTTTEMAAKVILGAEY